MSASVINTSQDARCLLMLYLYWSFLRQAHVVSCCPVPEQLEAVCTGRLHVTNHVNCASKSWIERGISLMSGFVMCTASAVDRITNYGLLFCRVVPFASGIDTVRVTQMHVNTQFHSSLFVSEMTHTHETVKMHVSAGILVNTVVYGLGECKQSWADYLQIVIHYWVQITWQKL